ncbi:hypothetical protein SPHINGO391_480031 [Sphingomonas aurantiaca]|uniref:Uncharacterized protein n=1 Tax=Sphingomonas aurantiaca TaxID=185949 RepID=A0A5E8A4R3_9SPHN|nr:hypothetical protein SPHINGO391_480031 [Sphingomonas aurantiaca]
MTTRRAALAGVGHRGILFDVLYLSE